MSTDRHRDFERHPNGHTTTRDQRASDDGVRAIDDCARLASDGHIVETTDITEMVRRKYNVYGWYFIYANTVDAFVT